MHCEMLSSFASHHDFDCAPHRSFFLMSEVNLERVWGKKRRNVGTGLSSKLRLCLSGIWAEKELGCKCCWVED